MAKTWYHDGVLHRMSLFWVASFATWMRERLKYSESSMAFWFSLGLGSVWARGDMAVGSFNLVLMDAPAAGERKRECWKIART
jgi:hypothetical protein